MFPFCFLNPPVSWKHDNGTNNEMLDKNTNSKFIFGMLA